MNLGRLVFLLDVDDDKFQRGLASAGRGLASVTSSALKAGAGLVAMNGAIAGLGGVVGIATQAAGAIGLIPAAIAAFALAKGTLTVGMAGFSEALAATGEDAAAFEESIAGLAPQAQEAARAFRDLRPAWDGLKMDVQNQLFSESGARIKALGGQYLPVLRGAMVGVAESFNSAGHDVADFFSESEVVGDVEEGFGNLRGSVDNVVSGFPALVESFYLVARVGSDFLPGLTDGFAGATDRFREFIGNARSSGDLHRWIQTGIDTLKQLGEILGNVGSIFSGLFSAANASGGGLLNMLLLITGRVAEMVNSVEGQEFLGALFETGAVLATAFLDVIGALLPAISPLVVLFAQLAQTIGVGLAEVLIAIMPAVSMLVDALVFALAPVLPVIANLFSTLAGILGPLAMIFAETLAPLLPQVAELFVMLVEAITPLLPPIAQLIGALLPVIGAILANVVIPAIRLVIGVLTEWWGILAFGLQIVADFVTGAVSFFSNFGTNVQAIIDNVRNWIVQGFENARTTATNAISGFVSAGIAKFHEILGFVGSLPGQFMGMLGNLGGLLVGSGRALVDGFLNGIRVAWNGLVGWVSGGIQQIRNLFPFSPAKDGPLSGSGYVTHSGKALTGDFATSLRGGLPGVVAAARDVMAGAHGALSAQLDTRPTGLPGHGWLTPTATSAAQAGAQTITKVVETHVHNPLPERASDALGRAGSVLAALGPWGDDD